MEKLRVDSPLPEWPGAQKAIDTLNRWTRQTHREGMIILRPDGSVAGRYKGDEHSVGPDEKTYEEVLAVTKDNLVIHSHPIAAELSYPDLRMTFSSKAAGNIACFNGGWSYFAGLRTPPNRMPKDVNELIEWNKLNDDVQVAIDVGLNVLGGRRDAEASRLSNRAVLAALSARSRLLDYRLHLTDEGKLAFSNVPGLAL